MVPTGYTEGAGAKAGLNREHLVKQEGAVYRDHAAVGACGIWEGGRGPGTESYMFTM